MKSEENDVLKWSQVKGRDETSSGMKEALEMKVEK